MFKLILFSHCFFFLNAIGQSFGTPFTYNDGKSFQIRQQSYTRYLRPQMKSIVQEFYQILRNSNSFYRPFLTLRSKIIKFHFSSKEWIDTCNLQRHTSCFKELKQLYSLIISIEVRLLRLLNNRPSTQNSIPDINDEKNFVTPYFRSMDQFFNRRNSLHSIYLLTEDIIFFMEKSIPTYGQIGSYQPIFSKSNEKQFSKFLTITDLSLEKNLPLHLQKQIIVVWAHFIKKIEYNVLISNNINFFSRSVEELNFNWNIFQMELTKGNLKINPHTISLVKTIHARWNSILKVILN